MKWVFALLLSVNVLLADPPVSPPPPDPNATVEAELRLLRSTVDHQQRENASQKARVAELTAQLQGLGIAPIGSTTQPAPALGTRPERASPRPCPPIPFPARA